jgi:hypothetical protein
MALREMESSLDDQALTTLEPLEHPCAVVSRGVQQVKLVIYCLKFDGWIHFSMFSTQKFMVAQVASSCANDSHLSLIP